MKCLQFTVIKLLIIYLTVGHVLSCKKAIARKRLILINNDLAKSQCSPDTNQDGIVERREWSKYWKKLIHRRLKGALKRKKRNKHIKQMNEEIWPMGDLDHDGIIRNHGVRECRLTMDFIRKGIAECIKNLDSKFKCLRHEVVTLKRRALIWMLTVDQDLYVDKCPADKNKDNMVDLKEWKNYWLGIAKKHGINYYTDRYLGPSKLNEYLEESFKKVDGAGITDGKINARPSGGVEWKGAMKFIKKVLQNCVEPFPNFEKWKKCAMEQLHSSTEPVTH